jgi:hypothetical protein
MSRAYLAAGLIGTRSGSTTKGGRHEQKRSDGNV